MGLKNAEQDQDQDQLIQLRYVTLGKQNRTVTGAKSCLSLPWQPRSNLGPNLSQGIKSTWPRVKYRSTYSSSSCSLGFTSIPALPFGEHEGIDEHSNILSWKSG